MVISNLLIFNMNTQIVDNGTFKLEMWKAEAKNKMKDALSKLNTMQKDMLQAFECDFQNMLMAVPKHILHTPIDINNEKLKNIVLGLEAFDYEEKKSDIDPVKPKRNTRRSKSANTVNSLKKREKLRSNSVDVYKTPRGRVRLSSIMSQRKFTVTKQAKPNQVENSAVNVKRIMKPDEMAISTCGSPLFVAPCTLDKPHINIPLPGGVVLNIEPKESKEEIEVQGLDAKTKNQLKMLCEQLKKLY